MADRENATDRRDGWSVLDGRYFREQAIEGFLTFFQPWSSNARHDRDYEFSGKHEDEGRKR